ncbi:tRNA (cytosine-5-)-methyltransferase ncl1 [Coemansia asiatica]|nr:tRNA (cytosine-5-)-methyltransferase ncl1 [Coemansia asiatica]
MGRSGKKRNFGNKKKGHISGERANYKKFEELRRDNDSFRKYYKAQKLVSEEEFPEFMETMRVVLPTNFRITGSRQQAIDIREQIMTEFVPYLKEISIEGEKIEPPHPLEWYPNNFGWQFQIPRIALKKSEQLSKFHSFLVTETEVGNISRQEAVSMVPPLFLDVQPSHYVLDMCAAPGSKTAQLIEALHAGVEPGKNPSGLVVANDADYKRACMLVHQVNRLNSPSIVVTNHSGERFPNIYRGEAQGRNREIVQFDRILCDVPCSGDGTTRKNVRVWEKWRPDDAHSLNPVQTKIVQRAAYLLKTGGRLVYSTCSLNPIENEAVVAHILDHFEGALQLVDVSDQLPALKRRPGLATWKVMTRDGELHDSPQSAMLSTMSRSQRRHFDSDDENDEGEGADSTDAASEAMAPYMPNSPREDPALPENPFLFLDASIGELKKILEFYGIKQSMSRNGFLSRMENNSYRSVYYVSDSVRELMVLAGQRLRVVNTGIRVFNRNCVKDAGCPFRLVCEGTPQLLPHLSDRFVVDVPFGDLCVLLEQVNPLLTSLSDESRSRIGDVPVSSSVVIRYDPAAHASDKEQPFTRLTATLAIPCWRGHASLSVHMDKNQLCSLIHRVLGKSIDRNAVGGMQLANNNKTQTQDQDQDHEQEQDNNKKQQQNAAD